MLTFGCSAPNAPENERLDCEDINVLQQNREPFRASFTPFSRQQGDRTISLNKKWLFNWTKTPDEQPDNFYDPDFNDSKWAEVSVPSTWQELGFPTVKTEDANPVGCYRTTFKLPQNWESKQVFIRLDGVASAFYVWVNGQKVGYSQGSAETAEFRLTPFLKNKENVIAIEVFQNSPTSNIEPDYTANLAGIYRDVTLYATEQIRISDVGIETQLQGEAENAIVKVTPKIAVYENEKGNGYRIRLALYDANGRGMLDSTLYSSAKDLLSNKSDKAGHKMEATIKNPHLWTAESPYLYTLVLSLVDNKGRTLEQVHTPIGFRRIETKDGQLLINGIATRLQGIVRSETNTDSAKTMTDATMLQDIILMKQAGVNAVFCTQPCNDRWYDLCDSLGLYVIDHINIADNSAEAAAQEYAMLWLDKTQRMIVSNRNHPCIIKWVFPREQKENANASMSITWATKYDSSRPISSCRIDAQSQQDNAQYFRSCWEKNNANDSCFVTADRKRLPAYYKLKEAYSPLKFKMTEKLEVVKRDEHVNIELYNIEKEQVGDTLIVTARLKQPTLWAPASFVVCRQKFLTKAK